MVTTQSFDASIAPTLLDLIDTARVVLSQPTVNEIVIDCSEINLVQSLMLSQLILLHRDANRLGKVVVLKNVSEFFREVMTVTRLDRVLILRSDMPQETLGRPHFTNRSR